MSAVAAYELVDGLGGASNKKRKKSTVWAAAGTYTKGYGLQVDAAATPGTGYLLSFKVCASSDTFLAGPVIAKTTVVPTGGGPLEVFVEGYIDGANDGLIDSGAGISAGTQVAFDGSGKVVAAAASNIAKRPVGYCYTAFGAGLSDGAIILYPIPFM